MTPQQFIMSPFREHARLEDDSSVPPAKRFKTSAKENGNFRIPAGVEVIEISSRSVSPSPAASQCVMSGHSDAPGKIATAPSGVSAKLSYDVCFGLVAAMFQDSPSCHAY
jgi:hypothetical protein